MWCTVHDAEPSFETARSVVSGAGCRTARDETRLTGTAGLTWQTRPVRRSGPYKRRGVQAFYASPRPVTARVTARHQVTVRWPVRPRVRPRAGRRGAGGQSAAPAAERVDIASTSSTLNPTFKPPRTHTRNTLLTLETVSTAVPVDGVGLRDGTTGTGP